MITAWDVSALLGSMTLFFALLLSAGKMKSWWERQTGRGDRVGEKCEAAPTAEARLAQAEAKLGNL